MHPFVQCWPLEVDGYVYNAHEEPKILMTGKWNEFMSYQHCDLEGEPMPGTELKEATGAAKRRKENPRSQGRSVYTEMVCFNK
ncbi:Hypothetical predicted protein [Olea europaea subsp. europaea]|uniref:Uncharacterized protein n=1 Tax=Olea europaea subsp. europaea TaxID=158383 RepID=A0A8S0V3B3_OLEEU|nr:Hypothetical predicted protein [Olea europaea subsp. europaea]